MQRATTQWSKQIKQLEAKQVSIRREIQQASADAHFWRKRTLAAASGGWGPRTAGWPNFPLPMQPQFSTQSSADHFKLSGGPPAGQNPNASWFDPFGRCRGRGRRGGYMHATADSTVRILPDT